MVAEYDVITIGGGLAGAALAKVLAERGVRVLVIEREIAFKDRVRGEQMHPWGVAEARKLGLYELLLETCGSEVRYWSGQLVGFTDITRRDLFETSPHRAGSLNFYHPDAVNSHRRSREGGSDCPTGRAGPRGVGGNAAQRPCSSGREWRTRLPGAPCRRRGWTKFDGSSMGWLQCRA